MSGARQSEGDSVRPPDAVAEGGLVRLQQAGEYRLAALLQLQHKRHDSLARQEARRSSVRASGALSRIARTV